MTSRKFLSVEVVKAKMNNKVFKEPVDIKVLDKLINSDLLIENEKEKLLQYRKLVRGNYAYVKYKQCNKQIGRVSPVHGIGALCFRKAIRNTLTDTFIDIDIKNCQPTILQNICVKAGVKCPVLTSYVENRELILEAINKEYNVYSEVSKNLFTILTYGGSFKTWCQIHKLDGKPNDFVKLYTQELENIGKKFLKCNKEIFEIVEEEKANVIGSVLAYGLQEIERQVLESVHLYLVKKGMIIDDVCMPSYDGIEIESKYYKVEILKKLNKHIKREFGLDLTFIQKPKSYHYLDILDDHIVETANFKVYTPLSKEITINKVSMKTVYTGIEQDIWDDHETIIIQSTTGTGKTTCVASRVSKDDKIISIVPRISLANQHVETFKKKGIKLNNYLETEDCKQSNIVICLNSLIKLKFLPIKDIKRSVVYIDEIASFLESLTDNDTMNKTLKQINIILMKIIKNAKKVIVSDAIINDGVFEFLKYRDDKTKIFFLNEYKKYTDIPAVRVKDEAKFLEMVKTKIMKNEPFLFPSDSCSTITKFYYDCLNCSPEEFKDKFVLVTADSKVKINDASTELNDKFVFYSPSITYGLDFSIDTPRDVFNYIKGQSIQPSGYYQQTTRTRNINKLYYYCEEVRNEPQYKSLEDCKNYYRDVEKITHNELTNMCVSIDEDDNEKVIENVFFNLFCYNEYVKDTYNTNKLLHFQELLKNNGFMLFDHGDDIKMTKEQKQELNDLKTEYDDKLFDDYLHETNKNQPKYKAIHDHVKTFDLTKKTHDELMEIKEFIMNKYKFLELCNFNRLLKNDEYINDKINQIEAETYKVKAYKSPFHKVRIIKEILTKNNMKAFTFDKSDKDTVTISYKLMKRYQVVFNSKAKKPTNTEELIKLLVNSYKNIMPSLKLIETKSVQLNINGKRLRKYTYTFKPEIIKELNSKLNIYAFVKENEIKEDVLDFIDDDGYDTDDSDDDNFQDI